MKLASLELPLDIADWPDWLERQIIGPELGDVIRELEVITGPADVREATPPVSMQGIVGDHLNELREQGLTVLTEHQLRALVQHPRLLLDLQEDVLIHGGTYWTDLPADPALSSDVQKIFSKITAELGTDSSAASPTATLRPSSSILSSFRRRMIAGGIAALLLLSVGLWWIAAQNFNRRPTWGFEAQGLLTADLSQQEYLNSLADAGEAWFNKRPETEQTLKIRLREFSQGCDTLIQAPHPQLTESNREWLVERCRAWQSTIDQLVADLEGDAPDLSRIQDQADETINRLVAALRLRSQNLG